MNMKKGKYLAALLAVSMLAGCGADADPSAVSEVDSSTVVETMEVGYSSIASESRLTGKVTAKDEVQILPKTNAEVLEVYVQVGDTVKAGDVLFAVDPSDINDSIALQQGERDRTAALYDEQIANAQKVVEDTRVLMAEQVRQAQQASDNAHAMAEYGTYSDIEVEKLDAALVQTKLTAEQNIASAETAVTQLRTAKANALAQYDNGLEDLREAAEDTRVTATVDGVVTAVDVVRGGMASVQSPAVTLAAGGEMQLTVSVSEKIQPWLKAGDRVRVSISALGGDEMTATITSVAPAANAQTHLYEVVLSLPDGTGAAYGMFASVMFETESKDHTIVIPSDAILTDDNGQYVYIVQDGAAVRVNVSTGLVGEGVTEVTEGLSAGDELISAGQDFVREGGSVRIVNGGETGPEEPGEEAEAAA